MDTKAYLYRQEAMKRWILLFIFSLFSMFALGTYAIAADRYYDESGRYMGRMDDSGRMYDKTEDTKVEFHKTDAFMTKAEIIKEDKVPTDVTTTIAAGIKAV